MSFVDKDNQKRHSPIPEAYPENESLVWERMLFALGNIFGTPKGAISTDFRERMEKVFKKEYPNLRCSTARAIFEGRIEGIPKPLSDVPPSWKKLLQQALSLLDLFETMAEENVKTSVSSTDPGNIEASGFTKASKQRKVPKKRRRFGV